MLNLADLGVTFVALCFLAMGSGALMKPSAVLGQFGVAALSADARNEVRAVYGGFGIAIAALLMWSIFDDQLRAVVCITVAVSMFGMALGRLVSMAIDKTMSRIPILYFGAEVLAGAFLIFGAST